MMADVNRKVIMIAPVSSVTSVTPATNSGSGSGSNDSRAAIIPLKKKISAGPRSGTPPPLRRSPPPDLFPYRARSDYDGAFTMAVTRMTDIVRELDIIENRYNVHVAQIYRDGGLLQGSTLEVINSFNRETVMINDRIKTLKRELRAWSKIFDCD